MAKIVKQCKKDIRKYFFSLRAISERNNLSAAVVSAPSINSFKNRLDKYVGNAKYTFFFRKKAGLKTRRGLYEVPISRPGKLLDVRVDLFESVVGIINGKPLHALSCT